MTQDRQTQLRKLRFRLRVEALTEITEQYKRGIISSEEFQRRRADLYTTKKRP